MTHRLVLGAVLAAGLLAAPAARAQADFPEVAAGHVQGWQGPPRKATVVDSRPAAEYERGHVPGAINVPPGRLPAEVSRLPRDRAATIVFYCRGGGSTLAREAAVAAAGLGYRNLYLYHRGFPDWVALGMPVEKGKRPRR